MEKKVQIVEVGLRDGLQNEKEIVPFEVKIEMARRLVMAGQQRLEVGAFVRSDKIPQMADSSKVIAHIFEFLKREKLEKKVRLSALVPNERGMQEALKTPVGEIAIFASATEGFSKANINCSIDESFERFAPVVKIAKKHRLKIRGYLSVCFGCPYEGEVPEKQVVQVAQRLFKLGCYEVSIGDTIGVATPNQIDSLFKKLKRVIPVKKLAGHFHDTRGTALANILRAYQLGVSIFDTSLGGLGGCPYAPGSAGNVATEDVLYLFDGMSVNTGLSLSQYIQATRWFAEKMHKQLPSRVVKAGLFGEHK